MITTFGINSKKYSDFPITYSPHTGFKWRLLSAFVQSSDTSMTVRIAIVRNGTWMVSVLQTTTSEYFDIFNVAGSFRYGMLDLSSLDAFEITQSGGVTGDTVTAVITLEVLPA